MPPGRHIGPVLHIVASLDIFPGWKWVFQRETNNTDRNMYKIIFCEMQGSFTAFTIEPDRRMDRLGNPMIFCGYFNASAVPMPEPKSPPCAPNFSYFTKSQLPQG